MNFAVETKQFFVKNLTPLARLASLFVAWHTRQLWWADPQGRDFDWDAPSFLRREHNGPFSRAKQILYRTGYRKWGSYDSRAEVEEVIRLLQMGLDLEANEARRVKNGRRCTDAVVG